jgi:HlyD family secretion protein
MRKYFFYTAGILLAATAVFFMMGSKKGDEPEYKLVKAKKGTVAEKALAVGTIEPETEIKVKSAISGIVSEVYFKIGDTVEKGAPLFKISPNPTPLEYAEARRNMELVEVSLKQMKNEKERMTKLFSEKLIPNSQMEEIDSRYKEAAVKYQIAREKFKLLEKGRINMAGKHIDSIIKSPITGVVLSRSVYVGDPVVPLTNFQPGTELCAMADMGNMLFKGTVDEIDVGKLLPGMVAEISVGALPGANVRGILQRISPKAKKDGNATLFDIEIDVAESGGNVLRAGYSATAYVKIQEQKNVVVIPERLVNFSDNKRFIEIKEGENIRKVEVKTGLSDSLNIEIVEGLKEGQQVVERPPREIT